MDFERPVFGPGPVLWVGVVVEGNRGKRLSLFVGDLVRRPALSILQNGVSLPDR